MLSKANYDSFLAALESNNIKEYLIRCEGGNRILYHNGTSSVIVAKEDHIVCIECTKNYASEGIFNIIMVPFDNIDDIKVNDISFVNGISIMEALGCKNDDLDAFLKQVPIRREIIPGTAGLDSIKVDNKPSLGNSSSGYVTK